MNEDQLKKFFEESSKGSKLVQELGIKRNEQMLLCTTTVLVLLIGFHKDFDFQNNIYMWIYRIDLLMLLLSLFVQVILLNEPVRTVRKAYKLYNKKGQQKLHDPSISLSVIVQSNILEKLAAKTALPLFFLSMFGILILGMLLSYL